MTWRAGAMLAVILIAGCSGAGPDRAQPATFPARVTVPLLDGALDERRGFNVWIACTDRPKEALVDGGRIQVRRGTPIVLKILVCNGLDEECFVYSEGLRLARTGTDRHIESDGRVGTNAESYDVSNPLWPKEHLLLQRRRPKHGFWDDSTLSHRLALAPPPAPCARSEYDVTCGLHGYLRSGAVFSAENKRTITVEWFDAEPEAAPRTDPP